MTPAQRREADTWIARLREPPPRPDRAPAPAEGSRTPSPPHDPVQQAAGRRSKRTTEQERLTEDKITEMPAAVRGALKKAALERVTTSWARLRRQLDSALPHQLHRDDQTEVLTHVDARTPAEEPPLIALLAAGDTSSPSLYRRAAGQLGRDVSGNAQDARSQWQADVLHLHQLYRYK